MTRRIARALVTLAACGVLGFGLQGADSYGRDYNLHRGFAAVVQLPRAGTGRLLAIHFLSAALRRRADYLVYLPPGYSPARRYPVDYLLHGMPGQPAVFVTIANLDVRLDNLIAQRRARPMILVFPDGRIGGSVFSDSEWANTPSGRYESYVMDVVRDVDARFSTLPARRDRVIGGFSAGAYGAVNIALHHLADFGSVQSWSGYFTETRTGVFADAAGPTLAFNSPYDYVARVAPLIRRLGLRVQMFVGRDDSSSLQQPPMAARLRAAGAQVTSAVYPGGHDWGVWYPRLNAMLELASRDFRHRTARAVRAARYGPPDPYASPPPLLPRLSPAVRPGTARRLAVGRRRRRRHARDEWALLAALLLAIGSAAMINFGFVLQQRGLRAAERRGRNGLWGALSEREWIWGQLVGWTGFLAQLVAVAVAPLTLVQAFAAGSLALSVPLAARACGVPIRATEARAAVLVGACLCLLPVGLGHHHHPFSAGILIGGALAGGALAAVLGSCSRGATRALAAGLCYGVADAAIKADALSLRGLGPTGLLSGWTVLAAVATLAGFLSFQAALRRSDAVAAISLMNGLVAVSAAALGVLAFGESLGATPLAQAVHIAAILIVLACIRPLAGGQERLAAGGHSDAPAAAPARAAGPVGGRPRAAARALARGIGAVLMSGAAAVAAIGLTYTFRTHGWLGLGPRVRDSLPLLQLAGFAAQPLARVAAAALLTGAALGVILRGLRPGTRQVLVFLATACVLATASDASFALAHNLRLVSVLRWRAPGLGPWLQCLLVTLGTLVPELASRARAACAAHSPLAVLVAPDPPRVAPPSAPEFVHH